MRFSGVIEASMVRQRQSKPRAMTAPRRATSMQPCLLHPRLWQREGRVGRWATGGGGRGGLVCGGSGARQAARLGDDLHLVGGEQIAVAARHHGKVHLSDAEQRGRGEV